MTGPVATEVEQSIVRDICERAWRPQSYESEADTPQTVEDARANNRARAAFCGEHR